MTVIYSRYDTLYRFLNFPPNFQMNARAAECKVSVTASAPMGM